MQTYRGSCHCGAVAYEVDMAMPDKAFTCNCSICSRTGGLLAFVPASAFRITSGADAETDSAGAKTDTGQRPNNEDRYAVVDTRRRQIRADGVLIVADGMGGRSFGEQAAAAAVETAEDALAELLDSRQVGEVEVADALATALRRANARVYELASEGDDRKGMGTTCVAAVVEGDRLYVAHAGDSRAYLLRGGVLRQVTHDHSYVAEQVRAGTITEEGARSSRFRNIITRAVGIEPTLDAEVSEADVQPGDMVLLCTDGLSNIVAEDDIVRALTQASSPQSAADRLVQMAVKSGGRDNITAVVARLQAGTRTLKMQAADLGRDKQGRSADEAGADVPPGVNANGASRVYARPRRPVFWPLAAGVLLLALLAAAAWGALAARTLTRQGYTLRLTSPYAVRPALPPPPAPPDPAHVAYDPPKLFYPRPVRGDFLTVSPADGTVTVAATSGAVLGLNPNGGSLRYKYALPFLRPLPPAPPGALGFQRRDRAYGIRPAGQLVCVQRRPKNGDQVHAERQAAGAGGAFGPEKPAGGWGGSGRHGLPGGFRAAAGAARPPFLGPPAAGSRAAPAACCRRSACDPAHRAGSRVPAHLPAHLPALRLPALRTRLWAKNGWRRSVTACLPSSLPSWCWSCARRWGQAGPTCARCCRRCWAMS